MRRTRGIKDHEVGLAAVPEEVQNSYGFYSSSNPPKVIHRKGAYDITHPDRVRLLASLGMHNAQIATAFGISQPTLGLWCERHGEFREAMEEGRGKFEMGVQATLLQRAMGYTVPEVRVRTGVDAKTGNPIEETTVTYKHVPADPVSIQFWLKNMHPDTWQDLTRQQVQSHVQVDIQNTLKLGDLSQKERDFLQGMLMKQIAATSGVSG